MFDENSNQMKLVKQKVNEKTLPPSTDIIKLIYQQNDNKDGYEAMSDEELEQEKQRLLKKLKEENSGSRKNSKQNKV